MVPFLLVLLVAGYLSGSLFGPWYGSAKPWFYGATASLGFLFLAQLWLFFVFFRSSPETKLRFEKPLQKLAFYSMGVISFLFTFTALRDLGALLISWSPLDASPLYSDHAIFTILGLTALCFLWGMVNARFRILTPHIRIPVPDLPAELEGFKIVQLSDVHLGTGPDLDQIKKLVRRALDLSPDLIALTGDIIDGDTRELSLELKALSQLKARYGSFFVLGNHECYWNAENSVRAIREAGITPLLNESKNLEISGKKVQLSGVNDPAYSYFGGEGPKIPEPDPTSAVRILLAHQPQIAKKVERGSYHLQLSGHTHGGQFFPWNWVVKGIYLHPGGLGRMHDLWVYVSHGTGFWGPPLRLGTDGEVTQIELVRMSS